MPCYDALEGYDRERDRAFRFHHKNVEELIETYLMVSPPMARETFRKAYEVECKRYEEVIAKIKASWKVS